MVDDITSDTIPEPTTNAPTSPKPATPPPHQVPSPPQSPIQFKPLPFQSHISLGTGCANFDSVPAASSNSILSKLQDLQSQFIAFQDETRVSLTSIADQLIEMENRLGAKLDTVKVQTEFKDEDETAP